MDEIRRNFDIDAIRADFPILGAAFMASRWFIWIVRHRHKSQNKCWMR
jgi:hypothetical protein